MLIKKIRYLFMIAVLFTVHISYSETNNKVKDHIEKKDVEVLFPVSIFQPLLADPKWPRFSIAYQYYNKGITTGQVFSPTFGATLPLVRWKGKGEMQYELGLHAGLFATMDIQSSPTRLLNSDYFIGPTLVVQNDQWDFLTRVAHTSSHVGDELLLSQDGKNIKRINLSYEMAEEIIGYNFSNGLRPFVGAGYIFHAEPSSYKTPEVLVGFDYRHPEYYLRGYARPVFGVYSKTSKNFNWSPAISIKGGLEFKDKFVIGRELKLLIEYYNGNSLQGQFFRIKENYIGISLSLNS